MTPATRQIVFVNTAHSITHYSLLILPTAVLAMAVPGGPLGPSLTVKMYQSASDTPSC